MLINIFVFAILAATFIIVASKRIGALINGFSLQSFFLFLLTADLAIKTANTELYIVASLLFLIKVVLIPYFLRRIVHRIKMGQDAGLFLNPSVSIFSAMALTYLGYLFVNKLFIAQSGIESAYFAVSISIVLIGIFIMIFRMKALAQIIGLLVMENGLFLLAASVSNGMPFFVEIAIFFDVFLCVMILEIFVYKINKLFTHVDIDKLTELKG